MGKITTGKNIQPYLVDANLYYTTIGELNLLFMLFFPLGKKPKKEKRQQKNKENKNRLLLGSAPKQTADPKFNLKTAYLHTS